MKRKSLDFVQHLVHEFNFEDNPNVENLIQDRINKSIPLIGLVVMMFNTLEKQIDAAVCEVFSDRSDAIGLLILHGMQYSAKVDLYKRLCDDLHHDAGKIPPKFVNLIERLKEAARLRNLVVHADWNNTDAEGYTYTRMVLSNKGMKQEYAQLTAESLEKILEDFELIGNQLDEYREEREEFLWGGDQQPD